MTHDVGVVIVAGGKGTRAGGEELKQFRWVAGKPMLLHSVQLCQQRDDVGIVVVVLPHEHVGDPPPWLFQCDTERLLLSVGGRDRGDSVRNGLQDLPDDARIVVVHDAARPLATARMLDDVIAEARRGNGAAPGLAVVDTLKRVDADGRIVETVDRANLVRIQTPQAFPRDMLERAHADGLRSGINATDDAALCERIGMTVVVVPGSERALKITTEADFARAEALGILRE
ncbi:MAG: 2-C-methyl-D-erythritol 4-phosphate cytidylyltransferase [Gemmatimonadaceae bacterium]|nr:2-C-methyl-D-erythritol 4-phosphate cytidylyltransferase [Gemmatimonadaceae bacterium]